MRVTKIAVRAALVCSAAGLGFALWSAADSTPAHAADRHPTAVEQPATAAVSGDLIGQLVDSLTAPADGLAAHAPGCPSSGAPDTLDCTPATAAPGAAVPGGLAPADIAQTSAAVPPMLARIQHARARSSIPAGPATRLEPRPA